MFEKVILKNFKSHIESKVEFNPGLNVFLGEVGAGKSSILEALSFALFGKYAGNVTHEELIRRGTKKSDISLIFQISATKYKVERTIHRKKTQTAKLWIYDKNEWKLVVDGVKAVSKSIENLLDVDSSTFLTAIYTSQGEIKEMLETQPGKRRERLDKLLGIDVYEKIWDLLGNTINLVLSDLTEIQENASGFNLLNDQKKDFEKQLKRNENEVKMLNGFLKEIKERLEPEEKENEEYEKLKLELDQINTEIKIKNIEMENSSAIIDSLRKKIKKAEKSEEIYERNKRYIKLEKDLNKERERIETLLQQKINLEKLIQKDETYLKELMKRRERLIFQLDRLENLKKTKDILNKKRIETKEVKIEQTKFKKNLDKLKNKIARISNEIQREKIKDERIEKLGECPTCLQPVPKDHKDRIREETSKLLVKLKLEYNELEKLKEQTKILLEEVEEKLDFASKNEIKLGETSIQIRMIEEEVRELEYVKQGIKEVQIKISNNIKGISQIKETAEILSEIEGKLYEAMDKSKTAKDAEKQISSKEEWQKMFLQEEKRMGKLESELTKLNFLKKQITDKYNEQKHIDTEYKIKTFIEEQIRTKEGIERLKKDIEELKKLIKTVKENIKNKRNAWKKVEILREEKRIIEIIRKSIRDVVQPITRKNNISQVSEFFQDFYQELSNDNIDYAAIDEEGNIEVIRNGEPSPVNSLSGGEVTCASLALRLAICSSLTKNQLLLLDEPTIHLDEAYREKLREFLSAHDFEQLIVVTHDNTFDSLPAQIFKVDKKMEKSSVYQLGEI
jgi:exonuclease SbcC